MLGFTADFPFHAIAPHWSPDTGFPAAVELHLSADGETFGDPVIVGPASVDAGPRDRDGRIFGALVFTDSATAVRYRGLDADGNEAAIAGLSFTYIDATGGPTLGDISPSSLNPSLSRPPIISRDEWGAVLAYGGTDHGAREWTPQYQTVEHVIIHHSETPSFRDPLSEIRSIHYYHTVTRGWGDIGYNYLVDFLGNVYEGRVGGENVVGGHAYQYAYGSSGICSMGSFSLESSTPEAIAGLVWITAWAGRFLDPLGQTDFHEVPNLPTICGHRDVNDSTCPGDGLYADLPSIRTAVAEVIAGNRDVLIDPEFSPGQIVATTVDGANLRSLPGTDTEVETELPSGSVLQVVDGPTTVDEYQWFQVYGDSGTGWLASSLLTPSDAMPPVGKFAVGNKLVVDTDYMNIRSEPTLRSLILATLPFDEPVEVVQGPMPASGYRWYQLNSAYGVGWAAEQYLIAPESRQPTSRFTVGDAVAVDDPEGLNLRTEGAKGRSVIATLPDGTRGVMIDGPKISDDITWLQIQSPLGSGWCAEPFLEESSMDGPLDARLTVGEYVFVDTDALNLREGPGVESPVIASLGTGISGRLTEGPQPASNLNWFRIETNYGSGWCVEPFLTSSSSLARQTVPVIGDTVYVDTDGINLRNGPGTAGTVMAVLFQAETGYVVDGPVESDGNAWVKLETQRGTGWGAVQYLGIGMPDPGNGLKFAVGDSVAVNTDAVNVRRTASLDGEIVKVMLSDEVMTILDGPRSAYGYTWFQVRADTGDGWAVGQYFRLEQAIGLAPGRSAKVVEGELNLRTGPGTANDVIAVLADGSMVDVIDGPETGDDATWFRVRSSRFGTGWCSSDYLVRA